MVLSSTNLEKSTTSKKCLIVDDEIAPDKRKRGIFANTFSLPLECCVFVHNYEETVRAIETRKDLFFCFLDYRIPKNATSPDEKSIDDPDFIEWGVRLIPLINFPILIYSGIVPKNYLEEEAIKYTHIIGISKKPFTSDNLLMFPDRTESFDSAVKLYIDNIFKTNSSSFTEAKTNSFDYASLDEETFKFVSDRTKEIKRLAKRAVEDVINIGLYLMQIKEKLGHGNFYSWLELEFSEISLSHAATLMRVAERFKSVNFTDLNILPSALYELSRSNVPDRAVEEVLDRARKGEKISNAVAKAVKLRYQEKERNDLDKSTKSNPKQQSVTDENSLDFQQSKQYRAETIDKSSVKTDPPPLLLNPEQKASLEKNSPKSGTPSKLQILKVKYNVLEDSFWQLGKNHRLFCGEPTNPLFLTKIPDKIALSIGLPPNNNLDLIPSIKARANYIFSHDYDDMDLSGIEEMLAIAIDISVGANNNVVFSYISHLPVLNLAVKMGCNCYVAEPNLERCEEIIQFWQQKSFARRLNN